MSPSLKRSNLYGSTSSLHIFKNDLLACLIYHLWGESFIGRNKTNLLLDSPRATRLQKFGRSLVGIFFKHLLF